MNIVYGMTRNLYDRIQPSIRSLLDYNDAKIYITAEDDKVPNLPSECEVINVKDQTIFPSDSVNAKTSFTYMVLMRCVYPSLIPVDKVISLDVDTIICDSLLPIWDCDMEGKWLAAVPEYKGNWKPYGGIYLNIGVALYNLKQMREDLIERKLVEMLLTRKMYFPDQDALNYFALSERKFKVLPVRYNECFATGYTVNPCVVHYAGYKDWWENKDLFRHEYLEKYRSPIGE